MEILDIYDENDLPTGRTRTKVDAQVEGEYHRIAELWVRNTAGEYLLQKRSHNKKFFPCMWYCTVAGGSIAGEDSMSTCLREAKEELGLVLEPGNARFYKRITEDQVHFHIWLFLQEADLQALTPEPYEVEDVMWADVDTIRAMIASGEFIDLSYYEDFFNWVESEIK